MTKKQSKNELRNLSKAELEQLERRFRERHSAHKLEDPTVAARAWRNRVIRYSAWLCLLTIAVLWKFAERPTTSGPAVALQLGKPAPVLGDSARSIPSCKEVADPRLAPLDGLAEGSIAARGTQIGTVKTDRLPIEIENSIGMRFRLIPAGTYVMGSPTTEMGRGPDEPEHVVSFSRPFYMGKFEVTQAEYEAVVGKNPSWFKKNGRRRPVEEVSWRDCVAFTKKLCELEGVPAGTYRLPKESEWEYACRAGTQTPFHCGSTRDQLNRFADFRWNNELGPMEVGLRPGNAWGLHDMHGNVWEWCLNRFYYYDNDKHIDRLNKSIRGGNWRLPYTDCRSASRFRLPPDSLGNICGFRIIRTTKDVKDNKPAAPQDGAN